LEEQTSDVTFEAERRMRDHITHVRLFVLEQLCDGTPGRALP
jgi:hypothetical protein